MDHQQKMSRRGFLQGSSAIGVAALTSAHSGIQGAETTKNGPSFQVVQCWDDGVHNDVRLVELLKKYKAKATFNINPGIAAIDSNRRPTWIYKERFKVERLGIDEMKDLYKGFTLAGHSMTHPNLTKLDQGTLSAELQECKDILREEFSQLRCGFAYPFGAYDAKVQEALKKSGYVYARTVSNISGPLPLDSPLALPTHGHFMMKDFWTRYEDIRTTGGVFYFWGHSYEMMDEPSLWDDFEEKLARISADSRAKWADVIDLFPT